MENYCVTFGKDHVVDLHTSIVFFFFLVFSTSSHLPFRYVYIDGVVIFALIFRQIYKWFSATHNFRVQVHVSSEKLSENNWQSMIEDAHFCNILYTLLYILHYIQYRFV